MQSTYEAAEAMDGWLLAEAERWCDTHLYGPDEDDGWEGEDDGEDGWTDVPYRGREHPADAPRYKAIGNSMAVPVMQWIGKRIVAYELLEGGES